MGTRWLPMGTRWLLVGTRWILVYRDGQVVWRQAIRPGTTLLTVTGVVPAAGGVYRAEIRGRPRMGLLRRLVFGRTLGLSNPVYLTPSGP